jgi:predicted enzyme related to lactoylglutathione lyase
MVKELGALILFTGEIERTVAFYREIGIPLEEEQHEDTPVHYACELGGVHMAIHEVGPDRAPRWRSGGSEYFGFAVASLDEAVAAARRTGARIKQEPEEFPWGPRALVEDPDGRIVELFERRPQPK